MRYGKGGEHLKVRVHGPEGHLLLQRQLLEERASSFFATSSERAEPTKKGWVGAPPIDVEDDVEEDYPDRTLLWTTYRRSHVSLSGKPYIDDDQYVALFTQCLSSGCEQVLALKPGEDGLLPHRIRQSTLIKALITGLGALDFSTEKWANYLTYHRDWLLRFILPKNRRTEIEPVEQLLNSFEERIARMGDSLQPIRAAAEAERNRVRKGKSARGAEEAWQQALIDLLTYVRRFSSDPNYRLDPFASDPVFSPIFKVFHGLGNQLGLNLADEALAHHILLQTTIASKSTDS